LKTLIWRGRYNVGYVPPTNVIYSLITSV